MSEENVEIVRRIYDAAASRDTAALLALYDPAVEFDFSASPFREVLDRHVFVGHEGLRGFFRERHELWETVEDDCRELVEVGDRVVSAVISRGRGRASGIELEQ